jgi:hypothetical protein
MWISNSVRFTLNDEKHNLIGRAAIARKENIVKGNKTMKLNFKA